MQSPCMKCEDRALGCFSKCQRYDEYKEELKKINEKRKFESSFRRYSYARYDRVMKKNPNSVVNVFLQNKRSA